MNTKEEGRDMTQQRRLGAGVVALALCVAACGGDDGDDAASADTTPTTVAPTDAPTTTAGATTEAPPETDAPLEAEEIDPRTGILREGHLYETDALGVPVQFVATADSGYAAFVEGALGVTRDAAGRHPIVSFTDATQARPFKDPLFDWNATGGDNTKLSEATTDPPADLLAYFATLPGVTVGPVTDSEFMGLPAKSMTYEIGVIPGGFVCNGEPTPCLWAWFVPSGMSMYYVEGQAGTLYLFDLGGQATVGEVYADEADAAAELLATMHPVE